MLDLSVDKNIAIRHAIRNDLRRSVFLMTESELERSGLSEEQKKRLVSSGRVRTVVKPPPPPPPPPTPPPPPPPPPAPRTETIVLRATIISPV